MKHSFPKKLVKWFVRVLFYAYATCFIIGFFVFKAFFYEDAFDDSFIFFLVGLIVSGFIFSIIFFRFLDPLGRLIVRIKDIAYGQNTLNDSDDSYLNELGEFYEVNKNLNRIYSHLKWQKRMISQESLELEALISSMNEAIIAVDQDQKILFFNTKAILFFDEQRKIKKEKFLLSEVIRNPEVIRCYRKCLEKGKVIKKKLKIDTGSRLSLDYEVTVAPLKDDQEVRGAVGLFYDITNVKKIEQSQIDFVSNVSHELRTPLTTIRGYVQALISSLETNTKEQTQNFLSTINKNVERLVSLLNHFLEMAQLDSLESLKKETLCTEDITQSVVKRIKVDEHKLEFKFSVKTVTADRHLLEQILYNLLDNAVSYVPKGSLIQIIWDEDNDFTTLRVKDQGSGIPVQHRERLFERFYRVDSSRASSAGGSGIGLSIVKQLLEKHGGSIDLVSEENEGSEFICKLPK